MTILWRKNLFNKIVIFHRHLREKTFRIQIKKKNECIKRGTAGYLKQRYLNLMKKQFRGGYLTNKSNKRNFMNSIK